MAVGTDNGPLFTSRAFMAMTNAHCIRHILIEPGRLMQTATSRASTASSATSA
jgi:putative transposase